MAKIFQNDHQRAVAYAAMKTLQRMLEQDGDLPPGFYADVTNESLTIKFPKGTVVERDAGTNGNGTIYKKATQNLYGYALIAALARRLSSFHQWNVMRDAILEAVRDAMQHGRSLADQLTQTDPTFAQQLDQIREEMAATPRCEDTPRICKDTGLHATLTFKGK